MHMELRHDNSKKSLRLRIDRIKVDKLRIKRIFLVITETDEILKYKENTKFYLH